MALVSISEAARLAGCTRANLYKSYIQQGKLSIVKDHLGKPKVETSELIRVFGSLQGDNTRVDSVMQNSTVKSDQIETSSGMDSIIDLLKEQLRDAKKEAAEREQWYRQKFEEQMKQITELTGALKLLEHQRPAPFWQKWFK